MKTAVAALVALLVHGPAAHELQAAYSAWVYPANDGRLLYRRDALGNRVPDFAGAGYHGGAVPIPDLPVRREVWPVEGDDTDNIQSNINAVASVALDANGVRGAVLLHAGEYQVGGQLVIRASGIVLRGAGNAETGTVLRATGTDKRPLIVVSGEGSESWGPENFIADSYVPVGIRSFNLQSTNGLSVGVTVRIHRPSPTNWLQDIDMWELDWEYVPGPLGGMRRVHGTIESWQAGGVDVVYERTITRLEGQRVFLDAPITCALEQRYDGGRIYTYAAANRIQHVGIEHLRGRSEFHCITNQACRDENHATRFIELGQVQHGWVRNVTATAFSESCVSAGPGTKWLTVADAEWLNPVSRVNGGRRYAFHLAGAQYCLVRNCKNRFDRHQFMTSQLTHGPNAFVDGLSEEAHDECGPHDTWATAALWDNILVASAGSIVNEGSWWDIAELNVRNRGNMGTGQGWAGANCVAWNTYAVNGSDVDSPPTAHNWAIGSYFSLNPVPPYYDPGVRGSGEIELRHTPAFPSSLYHAQMQDAMDAPQLQLREYVVGDFDRFAPPPVGTGAGVPIDPTWRQTLQALPSGPLHGFDNLAGNHIVGWTHLFQLDAGDSILSGTLWIALRATGDHPEDDRLYLNSLANWRLLSGYAEEIPNDDTTVIVIDLADLLPQLAQGFLNLAVLDDVAVDWSLLELRIAPGLPRINYALSAVADATVRGGQYADDNFGSATNLVVKEDGDDDYDRRAFLQWDLRSVRGKVAHAKVRLLPIIVEQADLELAASVALSDAWTEGGLTWNNQPAVDYRFASWVPRVLEPVEFNVTPQVAEALAGDGLLSIRLHSVRDFGDQAVVQYASLNHPGQGTQPTLFVTVTNTPPSISDITNRIVLPGAGTGPIPFAVDDAETPEQLTLAARSDNLAVVPNRNIVFGGSGTNRSVTVTPSVTYTGMVNVTVTVSDGVHTVSDQFTVLYLPPNPPPNVYEPPRISAIADVTINEDESTGPLVFTIVAQTIIGFPLQVTAYSSNGALVPPPNVVLAGSGSNHTVVVTPAPNATGAALIVVRVSDGRWPVEEPFTVTVRPVPDPPSAVLFVQPAPDALFMGLAPIRLAAQASDPDNDLVGVDFLANGQVIGTASGNPFTWEWPPPAPAVYTFLAVARDATGNSRTSAPAVAVVQPAAEMLAPLAADWRYFNSNAPPNWMAPAFDDSAWPAGFAPIGPDAERHETLLDPASPQITTFFRHSFLVPDPESLAQLSLRLHSPQGAVIYLNGVEVFRRYLPPGPVTPDTLAVLSASDGKLRPTVNVGLPPTGLLSGTNTLAVELHRYAPADPTFNFDLELAGYAATALPRLDIARQPNDITLRWPDWTRGYLLESTPALNSPTRWKAVTNAPVVIANEQILTVPAANAAQFFRLRQP